MAESHTILAGKVHVYKRPNSKLLTKPPARNTMHQDIVTRRQTLKTAVRHGWLDRLPDLSEPYRASAKISHRAWFSPAEYNIFTKRQESAREIP